MTLPFLRIVTESQMAYSSGSLWETNITLQPLELSSLTTFLTISTSSRYSADVISSKMSISGSCTRAFANSTMYLWFMESSSIFLSISFASPSLSSAAKADSLSSFLFIAPIFVGMLQMVRFSATDRFESKLNS